MVDPKTQPLSEVSASDQPDFEAQIEKLKKDVAAVAGTVSEATSQQLHDVKEQADAAVGNLESRVRKDPMTSIAIAAGIGLLVGALISR